MERFVVRMAAGTRDRHGSVVPPSFATIVPTFNLSLSHAMTALAAP
jgi:hypothetical protein